MPTGERSRRAVPGVAVGADAGDPRDRVSLAREDRPSGEHVESPVVGLGRGPPIVRGVEVDVALIRRVARRVPRDVDADVDVGAAHPDLPGDACVAEGAGPIVFRPARGTVAIDRRRAIREGLGHRGRGPRSIEGLETGSAACAADGVA